MPSQVNTTLHKGYKIRQIPVFYVAIRLKKSVCFWIFITKKTVWSLVFFDLGEPAYRRVKAVIGIVVVYLGDLAQKDCTRAFFDFKIVIHKGLDRDALAGREPYLGARLYLIGPAVGMDRNIAFLIDLFVREGVIDADQEIAAALVDDVFHLEPVKMIRRILPFLNEKELLGIGLRIFILGIEIAVAERDKRETDLAEITQAVVRNIPSEHVVPDLVILMAFCLPLFGSEIAKRRQADLKIIHDAFHAL